MQEILINKQMVINGLHISTAFYQKNIDHIFIPLLKKLTEMQKKRNRRIIVFIAAAPGTGKSTLVSFLENLSREMDGITEVQAIGIDGFHYTNKYLEKHHIDDDPAKPLLKTVKGSPASFDVEKLDHYLNKITGQDVVWPVYSRVNHDVDDDGVVVNKDIVLLEGNYLLLDTMPWKQLTDYADYTIFLKTDTEILKRHLIERKFAGGSTLHEAQTHYLNTDAVNITLVNEHSLAADLTLIVDADMKYHKI